MHAGLLLAGLAVSLGGVLVVGVADAWLSRALLVYLDALETNVRELVEAVRTGDLPHRVTEIDLKRDRGQDRARMLKMLGWLILASGFGIQVAAVYLARLSA